MRAALTALVILLGGCATQAELAADGAPSAPGRDRFVLAGDACGASRYAHLVGERYATLDEAVLPDSANVVTARPFTLEYEPGVLNVVVDGAGRIIAIGCF